MLRPNNRLKKGQVAMEFIILVGIAFFTFLSLLIIMLYHTEQLRNQKETELVVGISLMVQNELNSASVVKDGYYREFVIPEQLDGKEYKITRENNRLYFKTTKYEANVIVPDYEGELEKGVNTINKTGGVLNINQ